MEKLEKNAANTGTAINLSGDLSFEDMLDQLYTPTQVQHARDTETPLNKLLHPNRHNPTRNIIEGDSI